MTKKQKDTLYIVIPAYNEKDNIEQCINDWYPVIEKRIEEGYKDSRLVIINDGSKDNTYEILKKIAKEKKYLVALTKKNGGHGSTVLYGYNYAIKNSAKFIFQTDSDGQTNPKEFEDFWKLRNEYDAIIGNRVIRGDGKDRKFVENTVCFLLRVIFGVKVEDANAPFRLMKSNLIKKYIHKLPENYNLPNIMFTTYFVYNNEKVIFKEVSFKPREKGVNSINLKKIIKIGWNAIWDFRKFKKEINK